MTTKIPLLNQCSLSGGSNDEITIHRLSEYLLRNQNIVFPHRHDFYHCVLFTEGAGSHRIDFESFDISPWHIYFMSPGQIHTWDFEGNMEGYVINFDRDTFKTFLLKTNYLSEFAFFDGVTTDAVFTIEATVQHSSKEILEKILQNFSNKDFVKVSLLYFFKLLQLQIKPKNERVASSYNYTLLRNFMALLETNYTTLKLPKEYANLLYITPHHLNALCKESLGYSAGDVIRNRILLEAKRLLAIEGYSISEIAYQLNFSDNSYFTKFFKRGENVTPEEFRTQLKKSYK